MTRQLVHLSGRQTFIVRRVKQSFGAPGMSKPAIRSGAGPRAPIPSRLTSVFCTHPAKSGQVSRLCPSFREPDLNCAARKTVLRGTWDEQAGDPIRSRTPCPHPLVVSKPWKPPKNFGFVNAPAPTYIFQSPHHPQIFSKGPSGNNYFLIE